MRTLVAVLFLTWTLPLLAAGGQANLWEEIQQSNDVARLETTCSLDDTSPTMMMHQSAKEFRSLAYARLGALGTAESLAAVDRIDANARRWRPDENGFTEGVLPHPGWHMSNSMVSSSIRAAQDGVTYAVFTDFLFGNEDLLLIASKDPASKSAWSRPHLIPLKIYRGMHDVSLASGRKGILVLSYVQDAPPARAIMEGTTERGVVAPKLGSQSIEIDIAAVLRDSDGDGLTDVEEGRLGLRKDKADTDGDGIPDGDDPAPDFVPRATAYEEGVLLEKAVFATFGISGSRYTLFVDRTKSTPIQPWGSHGQVIYGVHPKEFGAVSAGWKLTSYTETKATVEVWDGEGPLAGGSLNVKLEKKRGPWYVVAVEMGWVA